MSIIFYYLLFFRSLSLLRRRFDSPIKIFFIDLQKIICNRVIVNAVLHDRFVSEFSKLFLYFIIKRHDLGLALC